MKEPIKLKISIVYQLAHDPHQDRHVKQVARVNFTLWRSQIIAVQPLVANAIRNQLDPIHATNFVVVADTKNK